MSAAPRKLLLIGWDSADWKLLQPLMEAGQLPLDQLLASYRRGAVLLQFCRDRLEAVEEQVKVLEDGQLKPWSGA